MSKTFAHLGVPKKMVSDNGTQFLSNETEGFLKVLGIVHTKVALYSSSQNRQLEHFNRIFKE